MWSGLYKYSTFSRIFLSLAIVAAQRIALQRALRNLVPLCFLLFLLGVVFCKWGLGVCQVECVPAKVVFQERVCFLREEDLDYFMHISYAWIVKCRM